ncbi:MAG TPA: diaminopimelate decarboxylase [Bacteroidaceae bacterium]|nr:diaminopimelate decarboxylase [Bacteroidaceae bacterium]
MEKKNFERPYIKKIRAGMPSKFGKSVKIDPIPFIDDVSVEKLIMEFGSPLFVISEKTVRETFRKAMMAFETRYPRVQFAWSYKTNYLDAVCNIFHQEGAWAEVVSGFEYEKAVRNGIDGDKIIFNGPDKSLSDLKTAVENDSLIHIDHFDELYDLIEIAGNLDKKPRVAIRVNMDTGIYPIWDRFGFNYENGDAWDAINRIIRSEKLELSGLHCHIGTYMLSTDAYKRAVLKLGELAIRIFHRHNTIIKYIDIGGGFATQNTLKGAYYQGYDTSPSFDEYAEAITSSMLDVDFPEKKLPLLILETGRALIDDAGYLLGTVLANKRLSNGNRATILDVGVNNLFTSFWYDHEVHPVKDTSDHFEESTFFGPLCMNIDIIRDAISFPLLKKGDQFVIKRIGAYNMTQWMQFITYRPNVVLIDAEGKTHIISNREDINTITANEITPDHLKNI